MTDAHRTEDQQSYAVKLQRLIEAFCRGDDPLPYPELHHSRKLTTWRKAQFVLLDVPEAS